MLGTVGVKAYCRLHITKGGVKRFDAHIKYTCGVLVKARSGDGANTKWICGPSAYSHHGGFNYL